MTAREPYRGSGAADRRGLLRGLLLVYLTFWVDTGAVAQNGVADLPSEPILRIAWERLVVVSGIEYANAIRPRQRCR